MERDGSILKRLANVRFGDYQMTAHSNNDLQQSRRFASTVSGAGLSLRLDLRKRALAGRAVEIKLVREPR